MLGGGILGGLVSANLQLDLSWGFFMEALPRSVPLPNLWMGLSKASSSACSSVSSPAISGCASSQYRKPVDEDNSVGGDLDYRRDPGRCGIRNLTRSVGLPAV